MSDPVSIPVQTDLFEPEEKRPICPGCGNEIDPEMCHCGDLIKDHSNPMNDGHHPVPMGCDCFRIKEVKHDYDERGWQPK